MIIILLILIQQFLACKPLIDERSIYPTVGEYFQLEMTEIFSGQCNSYQCDGCTNEIQIYNATEMVIENTLNQKIISVTNNETHFAALTNLYLIIYKKGNVSQEYQNLFKLPQNISCFNVIYINTNTILLNCYQKNQLIFLQFYDNNFNYVYNASSFQPQSTQIEVYFNQSSTMFLLCAQYYQHYSILTLLSNQNNSNQIFQNLSVCQSYDFKEFHSSYQFIYVIQRNKLYQFYINSQQEFIPLTNQTVLSVQSFSVYRSLQSEGGCDNIIMISKLFMTIKKFQACWSYIQLQFRQTHSYAKFSKPIKSISNNNFIFIFNRKYLQILSNGYYFNLLQVIQITQNTQLIYDVPVNILYLFQQKFIELLIRKPALVINSSNFYQNEIKIIIYTQQYNNNKTPTQQQQSTINIQILQVQDTNIYVQFQNKKLVNFLEQNQYKYQYQNIDNYSGQLLKIQVNQYNKTKNLGQYYQTTLNQFYNINVQDCNFCSILNIPTWYSETVYEQILVLAENESLILKSCDIVSNSCVSKQIFNSSFFIERLQLAYNLIGQEVVIITGIQINSNIINCIYYNLTQIKFQNQVNGNDQFLSYLLTYEGLYIIFSNSSINFYNNCTQSQVITIDQYFINKVFNQSENYLFNPINITTNIQYLSSLLFINNQTNAIIITLINNQLIPISRIQSKNNKIIYGINLINDRLILSFYNNNKLNFEVWNVFNIYQPYFEKNLFEISLYNLINIYSDNLFLYIQFNSSQLYIYNPAQSQHSALLTNYTLTSSLMCSTAVFYPQSYNLINMNQIHLFGQENLQSILLINSNLYTIYPTNQIHFIINKTFQNNAFYPQVNYNISISNYFSKQSINESTKILIYFYNFLNIYSDSLQVNYDDDNHIATILPISSQLSNCYQKDNLCLNYKDSNQSCYSNIACQVNFIDNQIFYLDRNSSIYQLDKISITQNCSYSQILNGANNKMDNCLVSVTLDYFIFAICSNTTSAYLIQFDFTYILNPIQIYISDLQRKFLYISEMQIVFNGLFILASENLKQYQLYLYDLTTNITQTLTQNNFVVQNFIAISTKFLFKRYYILTFITLQGIYNILMDSQFNILSGPNQIFLDFFEIKDIQFYSLTLIQQKDNYMFAFLTNNVAQFPLLMFNFHIVMNFSNVTLFSAVEYLKFLPGNFSRNVRVQFLNGYLILTNTFTTNMSIQIYSLGDYQNLQNSILSPILMQKQININKKQINSFQADFNLQSNLITYKLICQVKEKTKKLMIIFEKFIIFLRKRIFKQKIFGLQYILQINPTLQLICQFEPKFIECCSGDSQFNQNQPGLSCIEIEIEQPIIILNLLLPVIVIVYLLSVLYRMVFGKFLHIQDDYQDDIEL